MKKYRVKVVSTKLMRRAGAFLLSTAVFALFQIATAPNASAGQILASNLITMAILGGGGVTIGGTGSVITGSIGAYPTTSITGVIPTNFTISGGTVQSGGATAMSAQSELGTTITGLSGMTPTATLSSLGGLTLAPGIYSSSSTMDLTGTLTLDGGGNANALWVFEVGSALNTASSSAVNVINTGAGAGVYWVLPTGSGSAVLGSNSTFLGNILANQSISLSTNVSDPCGRLLTQVASVTLAGTDTIGIGCSGILAGSNGLSGGGTLASPPTGGPPVVTPLPFAPVASVPEPGTLMLLGAGIAYLLARRLVAQADSLRPIISRPLTD
jgi:Ice-binding-like/PEP-CTERM motif